MACRRAMLLLGAIALAGCPRQVGPEGDAGESSDSGYDPRVGNPFEGALSLDDERVRAIDPTVLRAGASPCREPILARVNYVSDGDTIDVVSDEGTIIDARVRLIGIDTPEVAHTGTSAECYGDVAAGFTGQLLERMVWLTFDNDCTDRFDRLLAYVHVGTGEGDLWQRQLLRRGFARVFTVGDNRAYQVPFENDEAVAQLESRGMWGACF